VERHDTYWGIVWKQFRSNSSAYAALWALVPLVAIALFAPLICSDLPLWFWDGEGYLYPWFRGLFHPAEPVDYLFNMALVGFPIWLPVAICQHIRWSRRGKGRGQGMCFLGLEYAALTGLLCGVFSIDRLTPANTYASRTFAAEAFKSSGLKHGLFTLIPFGPTEQDLVGSANKAPLFRKPAPECRTSTDGFPHLFGTDNAGRDVLTRMVYGTRISITVGLVAVGIYLTIGCILGAVAGYYGGTLDMLISRLIEVVLLFPSFFLILTLVALIGPSIYIIMVVIGITGWPTIARLIRGEVLKQRAADYVSAARALGFTDSRLIFRHILPNSLYPALVAAPFGIAGAIITEAGLSLLGFGVRPPTPTWGSVLKLGSENYAYWWLVLVPSVGIFFTVTIFNLIGSGLRDAMDPRLRATR
jgi:ABC-type dipeptide/oligopeptide/nickel transport system permease subunit